MGLRKDPYDKTVIIEVERQNETVPFVTKGRRLETPELGLHYEILAPGNPKQKYKMVDIPTDMVSSSGVIRVYTKDFEQFVPSRLKAPKGKEFETGIHPVHTKLGKEVQLDQFFLDAGSKSFLGKAYKDAILKTQSKTWWSQNHMMILTVIILAALIVLAYILGNALTNMSTMLDGQLAQFLNAVNTLVPPPV